MTGGGPERETFHGPEFPEHDESRPMTRGPQCDGTRPLAGDRCPAGPWRLIRDLERDGVWHMAVDEVVARAVGRREAPPTLRLYTWDPPAVSVGYFQDAGAEIDLERCRALGFDVVRRPTGGRAVLHHRELTYAISCPADHPMVTGSVERTYEAISLGLAAGIRLLGVDAALVPPGDASRTAAGRDHRSAACFQSAARYEILAGSRKLVGSAQVRRWGAVLQHGSILISVDPALHAAVFRYPRAGGETAARRRFAARTTGLRELLAREIDPEEVAASVIRGMTEVLGCEFYSGELGEKEKEEAENLAGTRRRSPIP
ncbi:MAG: lipoate--protein ligase family protein [Firmicutes bacterium]|nr:lipoate--protein ligase family protein [Bacillota bacterium]